MLRGVKPFAQRCDSIDLDGSEIGTINAFHAKSHIGPYNVYQKTARPGKMAIHGKWEGVA